MRYSPSIVEQSAYPLVRRFYEEVGYSGGLLADDTVLALQAHRGIVAAMRLCKEENTLVLRGMYVAVDCRRQGLGSRLLEFANVTIGSSECWCVPYCHLVSFYSQVGFREIEKELVPGFLAKRCANYQDRGLAVSILIRAAR